jgi:cytochrome c oxidase assembly protein subunit 15
VRLSNAGLSCPDWPTCYGQLAWPTQAHEIDSANAAFPERPVESHKAWREQVHRMLAGTLVVLTFALAAWGWRRRREAGVAHRVALAAAGLIVFQALLGMWTVTWKLKPIVVMAHLLGGMATFALLSWTALRASGFRAGAQAAPKRAAIVVGIVLLALQIALGGWTSSNYAALACGMDFPTCLGQWWPETDFREGFVLWRGVGVDYEGGVLDAPARTAIQLAHRIMAVLVFGHLLGLAIRALKLPAWRAAGGALLAALVTQILLGIANVLTGLPLPVATAHNAGAALLLFVLILMLARTTPEPDR